MNLTYSVPITSAPKGESSIYRSPLSENGLKVGPEGMNSLKDIIFSSESKYSNLNFIGTKQNNGEYAWQTYQQVIDLAKDFGSALILKNLVPSVNEYKNMTLKFIGVYSKNRSEYMILDIACILYGITSVPIYDTLGSEAIDFILDQTKLSIIACTKENVQKLIQHGNFGYIKTLICFEEISEKNILDELASRKIKYISFKELIFQGQINEKSEFAKTTKESIYVISYTSGTTGNPKGALMIHGNFLSIVSAAKYDITIGSDDIYLSFLPMAHVFERLVLVGLIYFGCSIGFFNGDPTKIKDDFLALKPTIII